MLNEQRWEKFKKRLAQEGAWLSLDERDVEVLKLRFGITDGRERTLEEIGSSDVYGVTRERIRQIESKSMKKIKIAYCLLYPEYANLPVNDPSFIAMKSQDKWKNVEFDFAKYSMGRFE